MCKTIKQKVKFRASPEQVFRILTDSKQHSALTGQKAKLGRNIGDPFSTSDGYVTGITVDLKPNERLVQAWRNEDFPAGAFSMAAFVLTRTKDGGTELVLTHRGVPKSLIPRVEREWKQAYWEKMKKISG